MQHFRSRRAATKFCRSLTKVVATVREVLPTIDDAAMNETWRLVAGEKEVLAQPRAQFLRDVMLSHWYQHRGQFSVYLRILNIPVPASWGPSADEPPLFMQNEADPDRRGGAYVPGLHCYRCSGGGERHRNRRRCSALYWQAVAESESKNFHENDRHEGGSPWPR